MRPRQARSGATGPASCEYADWAHPAAPLPAGRTLVGIAEGDERFIPARAGNTSADPGRMVGRPVHPRSRGEHLHSPEPLIPIHGSSPLARGTPRRLRRYPTRTRFIPARAGNTARAVSGRLTGPVHPRSRGEHVVDDKDRATSYGSSPLARGTPGNRRRQHLNQRFIPARAGNTIVALRLNLVIPVHPRSRGEHASSFVRHRSCTGSSPLARGTPRPVAVHRLGGRFIPARAGNTRPVRRTRRTPPVHPRSRGEHVSNPTDSASRCGSSPLARGTPRRVVYAEVVGRFIPARAGNTLPSSTCGSLQPVHPRSRGEHPPVGVPVEYVTGSSPLARGTPSWWTCGRHACRFIPARAGNTRCSRRRSCLATVHPRSRGEHQPIARSQARISGSSPLARGTPAHRPIASAHLRFIPARAGNTYLKRIPLCQ